MPHEIVDRWAVLQSYSDALPELVSQQMDNLDVAIEYFEWLQTEAMEGRSITATNEHLISQGQKPLSKRKAAEIQEYHVRTATERLSEFKNARDTIGDTVKAIQVNIELLNYKLLNTKPGVESGPQVGPIQLPTAQ